MPKPLTPLPHRLRSIIPDAVKYGLVVWPFGRLNVITTSGGSFLGVCLPVEWHGDLLVSLVGRRPKGRRIVAVWNDGRPEPMAGHYLRTTERARCALRIDRVAWSRRRGREVRFGLDVTRVDRDLGPGSVVHPWKWIRGSMAGRVIA